MPLRLDTLPFLSALGGPMQVVSLPVTPMEWFGLLDRPETRAIIGCVFLLYSVDRLTGALLKIRQFGWVPFNKGVGIGASMLCTVNMSVGLVLLIAFLEVITNLFRAVPELSPYAVAYAPLIPLTALAALGCFLSSYTWMWIKSREKEYATPLSRRWAWVESAFRKRGVRGVEAHLRPIVRSC